MTSQAPLLFGFGAKTTAREVTGERRLDGTTAIVTGGYPKNRWSIPLRNASSPASSRAAYVAFASAPAR